MADLHSVDCSTGEVVERAFTAPERDALASFAATDALAAAEAVRAARLEALRVKPSLTPAEQAEAVGLLLGRT